MTAVGSLLMWRSPSTSSRGRAAGQGALQNPLPWPHYQATLRAPRNGGSREPQNVAGHRETKCVAHKPAWVLLDNKINFISGTVVIFKNFACILPHPHATELASSHLAPRRSCRSTASTKRSACVIKKQLRYALKSACNNNSIFLYYP